jgi:hypothetical protein
MAVPFLRMISIISTLIPPCGALQQLAMPVRPLFTSRAIGAGGALRIGFALLGGANHWVQPFADGHPGAARGVASGRAGFWT